MGQITRRLTENEKLQEYVYCEIRNILYIYPAMHSIEGQKILQEKLRTLKQIDELLDNKKQNRGKVLKWIKRKLPWWLLSLLGMDSE